MFAPSKQGHKKTTRHNFK